MCHGWGLGGAHGRPAAAAATPLAPEAANEARKAASRSAAPSTLMTYTSKGRAEAATWKYLRWRAGGKRKGRVAARA